MIRIACERERGLVPILLTAGAVIVLPLLYSNATLDTGLQPKFTATFYNAGEYFSAWNTYKTLYHRNACPAAKKLMKKTGKMLRSEGTL